MAIRLLLWILFLLILDAWTKCVDKNTLKNNLDINNNVKKDTNEPEIIKETHDINQNEPDTSRNEPVNFKVNSFNEPNMESTDVNEIKNGIRDKRELIGSTMDAGGKLSRFSTNHIKCELLNVTQDDLPQTKEIEPIRISNIYSSETVNLIEDKVSIEDLMMEVGGISLFDLVKSNCGGADLCPSLRVNWSDTKTLTIGFLGAYGWSQVRVYTQTPYKCYSSVVRLCKNFCFARKG